MTTPPSPDQRPTTVLPQQTVEQPAVVTAPATRRSRVWSHVPARLGRARTSTVVIGCLFILLLAVNAALPRQAGGSVPVVLPSGQTVDVPRTALPEDAVPATTAPTRTAPASTPAPTSAPAGTSRAPQTTEDDPESTPSQTTRAPNRSSSAPATTSRAPSTSSAPTSSAEQSARDEPTETSSAPTS